MLRSGLVTPIAIKTLLPFHQYAQIEIRAEDPLLRS